MTFQIFHRHLWLIIALLFFFAASSVFCQADQGSATLTAQNNQLLLHVTLPKPPPDNLIVQLKLQSQTQIVATTPKAAKIDKKKSVVKWLVKSPQPKQLKFSVRTSSPIRASSASAVVTYRKPGDGSLVKIQTVKK